MNKKLVKLIWLVGSLSAIFISCNQDDNVGASLQREDGLFSHFVLEDQIEITTSTILNNDSLVTGGSNDLDLSSGGSDILQVGGLTDEFVGAVSAESYFQIGLANDNPDFGTDFTCDSIVIQFRREFITGRTSLIVQGNSINPLNLQVHELEEPFEANRSYFSTESLAFNEEPVGDTSFIPSEDSIDVAFRLETSFGQRLLNMAQGMTDENFISSFNGLAITSNSTDASIIGLDITSNNTFMRIYYHNADVESLTYDMDLSLFLDHNIHFEADRTGTPLESLINNGDETLSENTNNVAIIQSGVGLNTFIKFENLQEFLDTVSDITINLATLDLPVLPNSYELVFNEAPAAIVINAADENGNKLSDENGEDRLISRDRFGVNITESTEFVFNLQEEKYEIDLTSYFQSIIAGEEELSNFLLNTDFISLDDNSNDNNNARINRAVIDVENIRFRILYSSLN